MPSTFDAKRRIAQRHKPRLSIRTVPPPFTHTSLSEELDLVGTLELAPRQPL
jgi:hypothetical protein